MIDIFAGTSGPHDASIALVGESYGSEEAAAGRPFVGSAGRVLDEMLADVGIRRDDCFVTNVVNERPPANDMQQFFESGDATLGGLRPGPKVLAGLDSLYAQLDEVKPRVIVALGSYALWALTRHAGSAADGPRPRVPTGILDWRGSQVFRLDHGVRGRGSHIGAGSDTDIPVLPVAHPAAILRDWALRIPAVWDLRTRIPLALARTWRVENRVGGAPQLKSLVDFTEATTALHALIAAADVRKSGGKPPLELVCDIQTWKAYLITCVGIAPHDGLAYSLPFVRLGSQKGTIASFWSVSEEVALLRLLAQLIRHSHVRWIGQNFLYDRSFLWDWFRVDPPVVWDTLVAQNLLFPGTQKDLGYLSSLYCRHHRFWKRDSRDWTDDVGGEGLETHLRYNAEDCIRTFEIYLGQKRALAEIEPDGSRLALWEDELDAIDFAWEMQRRGMRVNQTARGDLAMRLMEARSALAVWLEAVVPQALLDAEGVTPVSGTRWFASPRQTAALLYEVLGLRLQRNRKSGAVSTDDEAIGSLKEAHPRVAGLFEALLEYRSLGVLFSTFVEAKLEPSGRFSPSFNPAGTSTFRFSSSKNPFKRAGNAQNIPQGEDE